MTEANSLPATDPYMEKAKAYDKQQQQKRQETRKLFDPKALALKTTKIYTLNDPDLGVIRYGYLSDTEFKALGLQNITDQQEITDRTIHAMLQKADPTLTYEEYKAMPFDEKAALTIVMTGLFKGFLQFSQRNKLTASPNLKTKEQ
jgi:hypothetical protein